MDIAQKFITDYLVTACSEPLPSEDELAKFAANVQLVLNGLVNMLKLKFQTLYGSMVQRVLKLIIDTLLFQYERGICNVFLGDCRKMMLQFLLSLRCDSSCRCLAYLHERRVTPMANAFVVVDRCYERALNEKANGHSSQESNSNAQRTTVDGNDSNLIVHFNINELWELILKAIKTERYWPALKQLFVSLKYLLHDRYFIQADMNEFVYPILAELVSYKHILSKQTLNGIAMATQGGIKSPKSTQAVIATTYCMLLIPDVMKPMM
ncbi:hypothetical protein Tsp_13911 [Trichinella spiralis]|uniref:hypothetical protein n=1 Tax=Trichinella spiralis TaxID=6334 RepID=UPI0001EFDCAC|nr:hypothetical protein Tsp_13911 [Trichinella spiralis]